MTRDAGRWGLVALAVGGAVMLTVAVVWSRASVEPSTTQPSVAGATSPAWSPDGKFLAYVQEQPGGDEAKLMMMRVGGEPRAVRLGRLDEDGEDGAPYAASGRPTWHPDGVLVFQASVDGAPTRLHYLQARQNWAASLLDPDEVPGSLSDVAFDARGMVMAFVSDASGAGDIRVRDTGTGKVLTVLSTAAKESGVSLSTDGRRVVFEREGDVWTVDRAGREAVVVAAGRAHRERPVFAGDAVVYFATEDGETRLVAHRGGEEVLLARHVRLPEAGKPAVSPDGRWVAFASTTPELSGQVLLAEIAGPEQRRVAVAESEVADLAFAPDGRRLAYTARASSASWRSLHVVQIP